jgi:hypothetical protein
METKDHLYLAKLITSKYSFGTSAECTAFECGCVTPDINPITYIKGHTYSATISNVKNVLSRLYGKLKNPADYFQLGRAVHYIGDYFTFPHTPLFEGTLAEHRSYERNLHKYIIVQKDVLDDISTEDISNVEKCIGLIDKLHNKYFSIKNSISTDWSYIKYACTVVALSAAKCKIKIPRKSIIPREFGI